MGKNKVRLSLFGTDYIITSDEEESYVRRIGDEVEKRITANMQQNTRISVLMSAVLTALDYQNASVYTAGFSEWAGGETNEVV